MQVRGTTGGAAKITLTQTGSVNLEWSCEGFIIADAVGAAEAGFDDCGTITNTTETSIVTATSDTKTHVVTTAVVTNTDASTSTTVTCKKYKIGGSTNARKFKTTLLPGESMHYNGRIWEKKAADFATTTQYKRSLAGNQSNSTTTPTAVTGMTVENIQPGTYSVQMVIPYQSSATGTGIKVDVNFTGTVTMFEGQARYVDTSATAATGAGDQDAVALTGHVVGAFAFRTKGTAGRFITASVDTANADMLLIVELLMIVTVAGNLEFWHGSETAAATTVKAGATVFVN